MHYTIVMTMVLILGSAWCAGLSRGRRATLGVVVMVLLTVFMIAGALPARGGGQLAVFRTPVFVSGLALLCAVTAACMLRQRRPGVGFLLCHSGAIVVLAGAFLGFIFGVKTQFAAPIAMEYGISRLPGPDDTTYELPFALSVLDFQVEFYQPDYHLYAPPDGGGEYTFERTVSFPAQGSVDLGHGDTVGLSDLKTDQGSWVRQRVLSSGRLLQMGESPPKHFAATLRFESGEGGERIETLRVNHPLSQDGWRFYLMSYDRTERRYVVLSARRDPGRRAVIAGLWMVIAGTAWVCWTGRSERPSSPGRSPAAAEQADAPGNAPAAAPGGTA